MTLRRLAKCIPLPLYPAVGFGLSASVWFGVTAYHQFGLVFAVLIAAFWLVLVLGSTVIPAVMIFGDREQD